MFANGLVNSAVWMGVLSRCELCGLHGVGEDFGGCGLGGVGGRGPERVKAGSAWSRRTRENMQRDAGPEAKCGVDVPQVMQVRVR
jgi:hypothetical protein